MNLKIYAYIHQQNKKKQFRINFADGLCGRFSILPRFSRFKFKSFRKIKRKKKYNAIKIIIILSLLLCLILFLDVKARPTITEICRVQLRETAAEKIGDSVNKAITELGYNYSDYVTIQTNPQGKITAIHTNAKQISTILNAVSSNVNKSFDDLKSVKVDINIGSLSGVGWLINRGFTIPVNVICRGSATSEIVSKLEESGINQTFHKIYIKVTAELLGLFPRYKIKSEVSSLCLISESLIIGDIPSYYAKFNPKQDFEKNVNEKI